MLLVQLDIGLAVAVFDDVDHKVVDDLGIDAADDGIRELAVVHHLDAGGILAILSKIGNDVGNAHHIAFQGVGLNLVGIAFDGVGLFQFRLKFLKASHGHGMVLRKLDLAVVTGDAGQGLQGQIQGEYLVQHPCRMNVVIEKLENADSNSLKGLAESIRNKVQDSFVFLANVADSKVVYVAASSKAAIAKGIKAGDLVKLAAQLSGGNGGGRPDLAQSGGKDISNIDGVLNQIREKL